jgi:flagellar biosynthesis protein FlhB
MKDWQQSLYNALMSMSFKSIVLVLLTLAILLILLIIVTMHLLPMRVSFSQGFLWLFQSKIEPWKNRKKTFTSTSLDYMN